MKNYIDLSLAIREFIKCNKKDLVNMLDWILISVVANVPMVRNVKDENYVKIMDMIFKVQDEIGKMKGENF